MTFNIIIKKAFKDINRNFAPQIITTAIVSLFIFILVFYDVLSLNLTRFVDRFGRELAIVIFLEKDISPTEVPKYYEKMSKIKDIKKVTYISPEEAYKRLEENLKEEKGVLEGLNHNFLPHSFEIEISQAIQNLERIQDIAKEIEGWKGVSKVLYGQEWIQGLSIFAKNARIFVYLVALILLFTAAFVVTNAINSLVYHRREEVEIMRLIGATNFFIISPFIFVAFLQGFVGSLTGVITAFFAFNKLKEFLYTSPLLMDIKLAFLNINEIFSILFISVIFCVSGTYLALRKSLEL
jgi:cell division transport system permease protein